MIHDISLTTAELKALIQAVQLNADNDPTGDYSHEFFVCLLGKLKELEKES